jgi:hypothetical protein
MDQPAKDNKAAITAIHQEHILIGNRQPHRLNKS